jgi:tetratricopeptide repeat protein 21B
MAGLAYCKGLFNRYTGNPQQALKELNVARFDNQFGRIATNQMILIYLNPANEMIFSSINDDSQ